MLGTIMPHRAGALLEVHSNSPIVPNQVPRRGSSPEFRDLAPDLFVLCEWTIPTMGLREHTRKSGPTRKKGTGQHTPG